VKTPDFKTCTEEELWKYIAFHLSKAGIESVLVGGAVVAIYTKGVYRSGDLDFITGKGTQAQVQATLETLGFQKVRGRHFEHPDCLHIIIEFPPGPVSIGEDFKIQPDEKKIEGQIIKILSPTDCIRDRLASYIHFNAHDCLDQAALVAKSQPFDLEKVKKWCLSEGAGDKFENFRNRIKA
jgi:hypothetical protein